MKQYIGRFAPTPTGMLHMGSLVAAIASFCEAQINQGQWLLRIEDLDLPREVDGASQSFIDTLDSFGFKFNQSVLFQSHAYRQNAYQDALNFLIKQGDTYNCACSRKDLKSMSINQHHCRNSKSTPDKPYSVNLKVPDKELLFVDKIQGKYKTNLKKDSGDCVLKRKDGLFSYQLAVVVDDSFQKITDIVRGIDLIESTPWQIYLNKLLNYQQPSYAHIPILVNSDGQKLSKQTFAPEITTNNALEVLIKAYELLNQKKFKQLPKNLNDFWDSAITNWNLNKLDNHKEITV